MPLKLHAIYNGSHTVRRDSATSLITIGGGQPPQIALTPIDGSSTTSSAVAVSVSWCDPDDVLASHQVLVNGRPIADTFATQTQAGCVEAATSTATATLLPGQNLIVAQASDAAGHMVSITNAITYTALLSALAPAVTPRNTTMYAKRGATNSTLYTVTNAGSYATTYAYASACGTYADCTISKPLASLQPGAQDTVRVWYTAPITFGTTTQASLTASTASWVGPLAADTARITLATRTSAASYQAQLAPNTGAYWNYPGWNSGGFFTNVTNLGADTANYRYTITSPSSQVIPPYSQDMHQLDVVPPGQARRFWINFWGDCNNCTDPVYVNIAAGDNGDSVRTAGTYYISGYAPTFGIALIKPPPKIDSLAGTIHEIVYRVTNKGGNYGDTIRVHFTCDGYVTNCRGDQSGTADQWHMVASGDTATAKVLYDLTAGTTTGYVYIAARSSKDALQRDSAAVMVTTNANQAIVALTPTSIQITPPPGVSMVQKFTITNKGIGDNPSDAFTYSIACNGPITNCTAKSGQTNQLARDSSYVILVPYTTPITLGDVGSISISIKSVKDGRVTASSTISVAAGSSSLLTVAASNVNPGTQVERSACLTVATGSNAAYECGGLRIAHPLPAVTTMSKTRAPTLTFVSSHADPVALIAANITTRIGASPVGGINATVIVMNMVDTTTRGSVTRHFTWRSDWPDSTPRRIVIPVREDDVHLLGGSSQDAGAFRYRLEVKDSANTYPVASDTGSFVMIDRRKSPFGSGWSLDGLEEIVMVSATKRLWVGGDGTTRSYTFSATNSLGDVYIATPRLDRADTLVVLPGGQGYVRRLPNGAAVRFDGYGLHASTTSRQGHVTSFFYTPGTRNLTDIYLPIPGGKRSYTFSYGTDGKLQTVTVPYTGATTRSVTVAQTNGWVTSFVGPDTTHVDFGYDGALTSGATARHLAWRTNRLRDATFFTYDPASLLLTAELDMRRTDGLFAPRIVHRFCPAESRSISDCGGQPDATPQLLSKVYTLYDGPRDNVADVADTTVFYQGRYATVDTIVNALGYRTQILRNGAFPLLPGSLIEANGHRVDLYYNSRGLDSLRVDRNPLGDGQNATTSYSWHPKWNQPTTIVGPTGERVDFAYDTGAPNRLWTQDGRGDSTRVNFQYNGANQVRYILPPGGSERFDYDGLGNLLRETTANGFVTTYHTDSIGRVDSVYTPIDGTRRRVTATTYDVMDRVRGTTDFGPSLPVSVGVFSATDSLVLAVVNDYDLEGRMTYNKRTSTPDLSGQLLTMSWGYDAAGRRRSAVGVAGVSESWLYDPAGNPVVWTTKRNKSVSMSYDALNRLATRTTQADTVRSISGFPLLFPHYATGFAADLVVAPHAIPPAYITPTETASFTYDTLGNIATALNYAARVARAYSPNGALKVDSMQVAVVDTIETPTNRYGYHLYRLTYAYDLSGRRISRTDNIPGCSTACVQRYHYMQLSGVLDSTYDGNVDFGGVKALGFAYDAAGRAITRSWDGGRSVYSFGYDPDSRLTSRTVSEQTSLPTVLSDVLTYDQAGRVIDASISSQILPADHRVQAYNGLGALFAMQSYTHDDQQLHK